MVLFIESLPGIDLFEQTLFIVEHSAALLTLNVILFTLAKPGFARFLIGCFAPLFVVIAISLVSIETYSKAYFDGYDLSQPSLREALEMFIDKGQGPAGEDVQGILTGKKYPPVFGKYEVRYLVNELLAETLYHSDDQNMANIPVTYNKGNDWYRATLGESMVYTSAIFQKGKESLKQAQEYKIDYVANNIGLKPGEKVLDIGCGWGTLVEIFTNKYKADAIGVTLSQEQIKYFNETSVRKLRKGHKSKLLLQDGMKMLSNPELAGTKFDKIVSLEMAEHVGIRRYDAFLRDVKTLLSDNGVFYLQVAGLKRSWSFEDFVWGLFMGEHIFPGADASVPVGWVTTHLERAGFEVQQVHNQGTHYSKTIANWLKEWKKNEKTMVENYGVREYRRWEVFLTWAVRIAEYGGSTVFMITATKQEQTQTRLDIQQRLAPVWNK